MTTNRLSKEMQETIASLHEIGIVGKKNNA